MECLACDDRVDTAILQPGFFRRALAPLHARMRLRGGAHPYVRFDRNDRRYAAREEPRRYSRPRSDVGDRQRERVAQSIERRIDRFRRIRGTKFRVRLRARVEAIDGVREPLIHPLHRSQLPLPEGFGRKAAICGVEDSVTDCFVYAPSPSSCTWRLCVPNDRYIGTIRGSLGTSESYFTISGHPAMPNGVDAPLSVENGEVAPGL